MDLSSLFATPEQNDGGFYEIALHQHAAMQSYQRDAHLHSMKHSQKADYGKALRLVLTDKDEQAIPAGNRKAGPSPWDLDCFKGLPSLEVAMQVCDEVVVRRRSLDPRREFVLKAKTGRVGDFRPISGPT